MAHLLNVVGKDGQELYETFTLSEEDSKSITKVFEARCVPVANVIYCMNVTCLTNAHKRLERVLTTSLPMFSNWRRIVNIVTLKMI